MPKLKRLVQNFFLEISSLKFKITKQMYRSFAIFSVGTMVVSAFTFGSIGNAAGKNALANTINNVTTEEETDEDSIDGVSEIDLLTTQEEEENRQLVVAESESSIEEAKEILASSIEADIQADIQTAKEIEENAKKNREEIAAIEEAKRIEEEKERLRQARIESFGMSAFTDEDYQNLLRIVEAEAGTEGFYGKQIVANVILNRVSDSEFPNTISGVVFSPGQFSPVRNGKFYSVKISQETVDAVENALNGEDNSRGALYFMNRSASRSGAVSWFDSSLTYLFTYKGHEFFK